MIVPEFLLESGIESGIADLAAAPESVVVGGAVVTAEVDVGSVVFASVEASLQLKETATSKTPKVLRRVVFFIFVFLNFRKDGEKF